MQDRIRCAALAHRLLGGLLCCAALVAGGQAQQAPQLPLVIDFDNITTGWKLCPGGQPPTGCAGGSPATSTSQTFPTSPSLDGGSMLLSESGSQFADTGWRYDTSPQDSATSFTLDLWFYVPSNADIEALEFDQFQYLHAGSGGVTQHTRLFYGTQCKTGSIWQVWDSGGANPGSNGGSWVDTNAACNYTVAAFNHLVIAAHRIVGDTSCLDGYPCMYYTITLNGSTVVSNQKTGAGALPTTPNLWAEQTGLFIQLDTNSACSGCTISEYIDKGNFSTGLPWWPAIQQILDN